MILLRNKAYVATAVVALVFGFTANASANLVVDGTFADQSNFATNWNPMGSFVQPRFFDNTTTAAIGTVGTLGSISQRLNTSSGQNYTLSFDLAHPSNYAQSQFRVNFGGTTLLDLAPVSNNSDFMHYAFNTIASSNSSLLQFFGREDPSYLYVTNVSVETASVSAVPLPVSGQMFLIGLLGIGALVSSRRKFFA